MKKALAMLLALVMVFGLCACGTTAAAPTAEPAPVEENVENAGVDTVILKEADDNMINTYTLIAVNPEAPFVDADGNVVANVAVNTVGAEALIDWMLSDEAMTLIADYGKEDFGDSLFYLKDDAPKSDCEIPAATEETKLVRLSTTTSVKDSGLLAYLLPVFQDEYGYEVDVQSAGTGKAIAAAQNGNADLILVHAKAKEVDFVDAGFGYTLPGFDSERLSFMYNYFVLCGPSDDPAGVKDSSDVLAAFAAIAEGEFPFISRGDGSGTHTKELALWPAELGITEEAASFEAYTAWYNSANAGMGACLVMAEQMNAYILTDKATFLTFAANDGVME